LICPSCSNEMPDGKVFCTRCGLDLTSHMQSLAARREADRKRRAAEQEAVSAQHYQQSGMQPFRGPDGPPFTAGAQGVAQEPFSAAFAYPFRGIGMFVLVAGTAVFFTAWLLSCVGFIITAIFSGYMMLYYFDVISTSSSGRREPPDWPDISGVMDIMSAAFMSFCLNAFTIIPLIGYIAYSAAYGAAPSPWIVIGLVVWGAIYYPMALIMVAESRNAIATLPPVVIGAIIHAPPKYYALCLCTFLLLLPTVLSAAARAIFLKSFLAAAVCGLVSQFASVYIMIVLCRILGVFFKELVGRGRPE
jgi:hypothetical protein